MGKCIICGCETDDFRCYVRTDADGISHNDYQCEECTIKIVEEENKKYKEKFNEKVLPYLLENNFRVVVRGGLECNIEEFPIKDSHVMYCVDIIRKRMEDKGYYENWIDIHWEKYKDVEFEVVDYLSFALPDKDSEHWVSYFFEVVGDNKQKFVRIY